jgi:hypothetical protein
MSVKIRFYVLKSHLMCQNDIYEYQNHTLCIKNHILLVENLTQKVKNT